MAVIAFIPEDRFHFLRSPFLPSCRPAPASQGDEGKRREDGPVVMKDTEVHIAWTLDSGKAEKHNCHLILLK